MLRRNQIGGFGVVRPLPEAGSRRNAKFALAGGAGDDGRAAERDFCSHSPVQSSPRPSSHPKMRPIVLFLLLRDTFSLSGVLNFNIALRFLFVVQILRVSK